MIKLIQGIKFGDARSRSPDHDDVSSSKLYLKFILPWTNHIYIEYELTMKWPIASKCIPTIVQSQNLAEIQGPTNKPQSDKVSETDDSKIHFSILVKGNDNFC